MGEEYLVYCAACGATRAVEKSDADVPGWFELSLNVEDGPNYWDFCSPACLREWITNPKSLAEEVAFERELLAAVRALGKLRGRRD